MTIEQTAQLYDFLVAFAGIASLTLLLISALAENRRYDWLLLGYMAVNTVIIGSIYIGMHATHQATVALWYIKVRFSLLQFSYLLGSLITIRSFSLGRNRLSNMVLAMQTAVLLSTMLFWNGNEFDGFIFKRVEFIKVGEIWLRTHWEAGLFNFVFISSNLISFFVLLYLMRGVITNAIRNPGSTLRARILLLYVIPFLLPGFFTTLLGARPLSLLSVFNISPIMFALFNTVIFIFIQEYYLILLPHSQEWLFRNMADPILILNNQNELLDANDAAVKLFELDLVSDLGVQVKQAIAAFHNALLDPDQAAPEQLIIDTHSGEKRVFLSTANSIYQRNGVLVCKVVVLRDNTDAIQKSEAINRLNLIHQNVEKDFLELTPTLDMHMACMKAFEILIERIETAHIEVLLPWFDNHQPLVYQNQDFPTEVLKQISHNLGQEKPQGLLKTTAKDGTLGLFSLIEWPLVFEEESLGTLLLVLPAEVEASLGDDGMTFLQIYTYRLAHYVAHQIEYLDQQNMIRLNERQHIAREMHDSVMQLLSSANMIAKATMKQYPKMEPGIQENLNSLSQLMLGASQEMRTMLYELRPESINKLPLNDLILTLIEAYQTHTQARIQFKPKGNIDLPPDEKINLYRIAQESIVNSIRHGNPKNILVTLNSTKKYAAILHIIDDGIGLDQTKPVRSQGLGIMRERAGLIHAQLSIQSKPLHGTSVTVKLPR